MALTCADCSASTRGVNPDIARIALIKFKAELCMPCYTRRKEQERLKNARQVPQPHRQDDIADRVGFDSLECDCGLVVPVSESVRVMRKSTGTITRVCKQCEAKETCKVNTHHLVTPQHRDWDEGRITFQPIPDNLKVAFCSTCGLEMRWDGERWRRMTWAVLAEAWANA